MTAFWKGLLLTGAVGLGADIIGPQTGAALFVGIVLSILCRIDERVKRLAGE